MLMLSAMYELGMMVSSSTIEQSNRIGCRRIWNTVEFIGVEDAAVMEEEEIEDDLEDMVRVHRCYYNGACCHMVNIVARLYP